MSAGTRASTAADLIEQLGGTDTITVDVSGVTVEIVDAVGCGALGCREDEDLVRAQIDGYGTRVVCPEHLEDLITREADA